MSNSKCTVSIVSSSKVGEIDIQCNWQAIMGDVEQSLREQARIGDILQGLGLQVKFCQFDWPSSRATYYIRAYGPRQTKNERREILKAEYKAKWDRIAAFDRARSQARFYDGQDR